MFSMPVYHAFMVRFHMYADLETHDKNMRGMAEMKAAALKGGVVVGRYIEKLPWMA